LTQEENRVEEELKKWGETQAGERFKEKPAAPKTK
jgi:hypothetical protein